MRSNRRRHHPPLRTHHVVPPWKTASCQRCAATAVVRACVKSCVQKAHVCITVHNADVHTRARARGACSLCRACVAQVTGCRIVPAACYCFHVTGSPVKELNPDAWRQNGVSKALRPGIGREDRIRSLSPAEVQANCSCLAPKPGGRSRCMFGDMRPGKLLAVIAACRRLGITHIVEEGRYVGARRDQEAQRAYKERVRVRVCKCKRVHGMQNAQPHTHTGAARALVCSSCVA